MHGHLTACRSFSNKLSRKTVTLCALLCAFQAATALDSHKPLSQYRRQTWQIDSGLPQNTVHAVVQSRDGFIWMATEGGLVRFDGVDFRTFDTSDTPEMRSNVVDDLMEDRDGSLWISTSDGLVRLSKGRFTAFTAADGLPSNAVMSVSQQRSGRLIVATAAGLAIVEGDRFRDIAGTELVSSTGRVILLTDDAHGTLWAATGQQLISVSAGSAIAERPIPSQVDAIQAIVSGARGEIWVGGTRGLQCIGNGKQCGGLSGGSGPQSTMLSSRNVTALIPGAHGASAREMWIGTTTGLALYTNGSIKEIGVQEGLGGVNIHRLFEDRSGALWVMYSHGLARITEGRIEIAPPQTSVSDVLAVLEDSEGNLWFGTESDGISVLRDQMFSSVSLHQGPSADFIRTMFQDRAGTIWLGTSGGGLYSLSDSKMTPLQASARLSSGVVLSLAETGQDIWVGTPDGLTRIRNGQTELFTSADGLPDNFVRSLFADSDGSLWIGTRNGLSHLSNGVFRSYSTQDGLGNDVIGSVLRTRAGELWVATLGGLSRLAGDRFVNYTKRDGLGGDAVTALFEDSEGSLWIGTNGSGLNRLRNGRLTPFSPQKTEMPEDIYGILEDQTNNLWLSSHKGVYRVSIGALNAYENDGTGRIPLAVFGAADGMQISECSSGGHPAAWRMQDGTLWFATPKGVAWTDPKSSAASMQVPKIAIEQVTIDDRPTNLAVSSIAEQQVFSELIVPPGRERITIHYAGLSFRAPQKVHYRYILQGFDRDWVEAGAARTAYYTNVPPGQYRYSVMASFADGAWSEPASFEIRVQPRFFQTRWFYLLAATCIFGLAYLAYRMRVRSVKARYQAVMTERGRIAREVHDTLAQGYVGISVQLEITSRLLRNSDGSHDAALEKLNETKELVRSNLAEARSSIWNLRSEGEEAGILPSRLVAAARLRTPSDGPALNFGVHGTYRHLPQEIEDEILRIGQEAVNNAARHANASHIGVTLTYDAKTVTLSVSDDGEGFKGAPNSFVAQGHFGLQGMYERAAAIGAELHVDGRPDEGTVVTLKVNVLREVEKGDT